MSKTFAQIAQSMINYINRIYPTVSTAEGELLTDVSINAPSKEIAQEYVDLDIVSGNQSLLTATDSGLDVLAQNFGLKRKSATSSKGIITFFTVTPPSSDITIPVGTNVATLPSTSGEDVITFVTTSDVTFFQSLAAIYYNVSTGWYEISVSIESLTQGISTIVGANTIKSMPVPVSGVSGCYNPEATTGGSEKESSISLQARIASILLRGQSGTIDGIKNTISSVPGVLDVVVIANEQTGRDEFGAVDVYVKGINYQEAQDIYSPIRTTGLFDDIVLLSQPVDSIQTVSSVSAGSVSPTAYSLIKDGGSYGGSVYGLDTLSWVGTHPAVSLGSIIINYTYNSLIYDIQKMMLDPTRALLNTSLMIKAAIPCYITLSLNYKLVDGFDHLSVEADMSTALSVLLDSLGIGQIVAQSDIVKALLNVSGVDEIKIPFAAFNGTVNGVSAVIDEFGDLVIPFNSYPTSYVSNFIQVYK